MGLNGGTRPGRPVSGFPTPLSPDPCPQGSRRRSLEPCASTLRRAARGGPAGRSLEIDDHAGQALAPVERFKCCRVIGYRRSDLQFVSHDSDVLLVGNGRKDPSADAERIHSVVILRSRRRRGEGPPTYLGSGDQLLRLSPMGSCRSFSLSGARAAQERWGPAEPFDP